MATPFCSPARARLKAGGKLPGNVVVSTVMANLGLEKALERAGIRMVRTPWAISTCSRRWSGWGRALGGEQSGHIIFREYATTGDGILTALRLFEIARQAGVGLDELTADLKVFPQRLVNVRVREKKDWRRRRPSPRRSAAWSKPSPEPAASWCASPEPSRSRASWWKVPTWNASRVSAAASPRPFAARWELDVEQAIGFCRLSSSPIVVWLYATDQERRWSVPPDAS